MKSSKALLITFALLAASATAMQKEEGSSPDGNESKWSKISETEVDTWPPEAQKKYKAWLACCEAIKDGEKAQRGVESLYAGREAYNVDRPRSKKLLEPPTITSPYFKGTYPDRVQEGNKELLARLAEIERELEAAVPKGYQSELQEERESNEDEA
ncbi:hypothetical protein FA10DRAFT_262246 [Acaromyces ingoldii]|uniref:Uncharacterized protein n=1 Tax=Acaromyces ingoldii TaxID=215250 RepID=A0A316YJ88_9BASI|nr:hypothetical protein FA10DRAFT_262246 [Acaromyces ingoldii]PWN87785.1 hypothetical protein FA10DRAFT_262246 [Acaromyces ingoldii]